MTELPLAEEEPPQAVPGRARGSQEATEGTEHLRDPRTPQEWKMTKMPLGKEGPPTRPGGPPGSSTGTGGLEEAMAGAEHLRDTRAPQGWKMTEMPPAKEEPLSHSRGEDKGSGALEEAMEGADIVRGGK